MKAWLLNFIINYKEIVIKKFVYQFKKIDGKILGIVFFFVLKILLIFVSTILEKKKSNINLKLFLVFSSFNLNLKGT